MSLTCVIVRAVNPHTLSVNERQNLCGPRFIHRVVFFFSVFTIISRLVSEKNKISRNVPVSVLLWVRSWVRLSWVADWIMRLLVSGHRVHCFRCYINQTTCS